VQLNTMKMKKVDNVLLGFSCLTVDILKNVPSFICNMVC